MDDTLAFLRCADKDTSLNISENCRPDGPDGENCEAVGDPNITPPERGVSR